MSLETCKCSDDHDRGMQYMSPLSSSNSSASPTMSNTSRTLKLFQTWFILMQVGVGGKLRSSA
jgi:hypothetical protein